jgi:hypothetical protein
MDDDDMKLTPLHWHEALDRTSIVLDMFDRAVSCHPVIEQTPELQRLAEGAAAQLAALYQAIGSSTPEEST